MTITPQNTYSEALVITPTDGVLITKGPCSAVMATVAGNLRIATADQYYNSVNNNVPIVTVTIPIAAGQIIPLRCAYIYNTGTTATGIIALY